jgi:hypothetical protein
VKMRAQSMALRTVKRKAQSMALSTVKRRALSMALPTVKRRAQWMALQTVKTVLNVVENLTFTQIGIYVHIIKERYIDAHK